MQRDYTNHLASPVRAAADVLVWVLAAIDCAIQSGALATESEHIFDIGDKAHVSARKHHAEPFETDPCLTLSAGRTSVSGKPSCASVRSSRSPGDFVLLLSQDHGRSYTHYWRKPGISGELYGSNRNETPRISNGKRLASNRSIAARFLGTHLVDSTQHQGRP